MGDQLEKKLREKLEAEERKQHLKETDPLLENRLIEAAVLFLGTVIPLYILFYVAHYLFMLSFGLAFGFLGIGIDWIYPVIHAAIIIAGIYSVYRKRSVLDDIFKRL
jgi:hypothetical protein